MAPNRGGRKGKTPGKKGTSGGTIRNVVLLLFFLQVTDEKTRCQRPFHAQCMLLQRDASARHEHAPSPL